MTIVYAADGTHFPPRGVLGGGTGKAAETYKIGKDGEHEVLPAFAEVVVENGTKLGFTACGGGGYGDPLRRDPARVLATANKGWISPEAARAAYKVVLTASTTEPGTFVINETETASLRKTA